MSKFEIFPWFPESRQMMVAFQRLIEVGVDELRDRLISGNNVQHFSHGTGWQSHNSDDPDEVSELKSHSHEMMIRFDDIKIGRLAIIQEQADTLIRVMHESFERLMFQTVSDGADRVGNVVHNKGNTAAAFLEMLEKIEFGVDRQGKASLPMIVVAPGDAYKLDSDRLAAQMPDIQARVEAITKQKAEAAELREKQRREKFRRADL